MKHQRGIINAVAALAVVILVAGLCGAAAAQDGLIGYWPFNSGGADLSGGDRDMVLANGADLAGGLFGRGLDLHDNGAQFASRPGNDGIFNFGTSDFTVQIWVNFNNTDREQTLIEKFYGGGGPGWTLTKLDGNALHFWANPAVIFSSGPLQISSNVWHQFMVRRSESRFEILFDGAVVAEAAAWGSPMPDTDMPLLVGKRNDHDGRDFAVDGRIDEVAVWDRALNDWEVAALYNNGKGHPVFVLNGNGRQ